MTTTAPFGSWKSPITSALLTSSGIGFSELHFSNGNLYWLESRPDEAGRVVIVRCELSGDLPDAIPQGFNARTRVHEYGGGAYFVHNDTIFFSNFKDQRLYRQDPGVPPNADHARSAVRRQLAVCRRPRDARRQNDSLRSRTPRAGPRSDQRDRGACRPMVRASPKSFCPAMTSILFLASASDGKKARMDLLAPSSNAVGWYRIVGRRSCG